MKKKTKKVIWKEEGRRPNKTLTEIAHARGRTMEELFQYDVSYTSYLFVEDLTMTKPQKMHLSRSRDKTIQ